MSHPDCQGCSEYQNISRRRFLAAGGAAAALSAIAPAWLPRIALARDHRSAQRDVLITIFLRGGMDGLSLCVPHGEGAYYAARPVLSVAQPGSGSDAAIDLDGFFGFHPAMAPLMPAYANGHLLAVHAAGYIHSNRSHFDSELEIEVGANGSPNYGSGWIARHLGVVAPHLAGAPLRGMGMRADLQQSLQGGPKSLPIPRPGSFSLSGSPGSAAAREAVLEAMHNAADDPLRTNALDSLAALELLRTIHFTAYQPAGGADYGFMGMGLSLRAAAALIKAQVGLEAIAIDIGGWDTHVEHGTIGGTFHGLLSQVADALGAFYTDMTTGQTPGFTVVVMSEFGRRVNEFGTGIDHGYGNCMLVLGRCIAGGRVLADWPGLGPEQLYQGLDLDITTEYRDILGEIVQNRLGNSDLATVFPGYTPNFRGITTAC